MGTVSVRVSVCHQDLAESMECQTMFPAMLRQHYPFKVMVGLQLAAFLVVMAVVVTFLFSQLTSPSSL